MPDQLSSSISTELSTHSTSEARCNDKEGVSNCSKQKQLIMTVRMHGYEEEACLL